MSHDLLAELAGYHNELAGVERRNRPERAAAIRDQIDKVCQAITSRVESLLVKAEGYEADGRDLLAAQARVEAKRLARGLPDDRRPAKLRPLFHDGGETATTPGPDERAVPTKTGSEAPKRARGKES